MKRVAGVPLVPKVRRSVIDVPRHQEGLSLVAGEIRVLVGRLVAGYALLASLALDDPKRATAEKTWTRLTICLHTALRSAYSHWVLLQIALPYDEALAIWGQEMPSRPEMEAIGVPKMIDYWRTRTDPPEWLTHEEGRLLVKNSYPPVWGADQINGGIESFYDAVPFD